MAKESGDQKYEKVVTPVFRGAFLNLFEASTYGDGGPKYDITGIFDPAKFSPKDKQRFLAMQALADKVSLKAFGKKYMALPANFKKPFRDGEEKADLEGFTAGKPFARMSSKQRPGLIDIYGNDLTDRSEVYPGAFYRATVTCYAYDNKGKGVAFGLNNVQKIADGDRLDARANAAGDFADEEVDEEWLKLAEEGGNGGGDVDPLATGGAGQDDEIPF